MIDEMRSLKLLHHFYPLYFFEYSCQHVLHLKDLHSRSLFENSWIFLELAVAHGWLFHLVCIGFLVILEETCCVHTLQTMGNCLWLYTISVLRVLIGDDLVSLVLSHRIILLSVDTLPPYVSPVLQSFSLNVFHVLKCHPSLSHRKWAI